MYDMYPNYSEAMKERGAGGLGHYDYPVYENPQDTEGETDSSRERQSQYLVDKEMGYVAVKDMFSDSVGPTEAVHRSFNTGA